MPDQGGSPQVTERAWPGWVALALAVGVAAFAVAVHEPPPAESADAPSGVFSAARAMKHAEVIAVEVHPTASAPIEGVRTYLLDTLRSLGLDPEVQKPTDPNAPIRNVVVRLPGKGPRGKKSLLLCAHHDSTRFGPGAGDNASGVAAILETLRALKSGPPLDRDVIVLFDDGEEAGLLGAHLFVNEHPWAKDVGVVVNLDARGNHGPSFMFETSEQNGWLIRRFAEASPHPFATSFSMDIYRLMPNDTNLTVFKRAGLDGLNFAFARGLPYYHTAKDTPANLDPRTLQHQGENTLALTRSLGRQDLDDPRAEPVLYFSVLARKTVFYPLRLAPTLAWIPAGLWLLALVVGLARGRVQFPGLLVGVLAWPLALLAAVMAVGGVWLVVRDLFETLGITAGEIDQPILWSLAVVAAVVTLAIERRAAKAWGLDAVALGAFAWWVALAFATARYLPGMSYLFTWPAAFALLGMALAMLMPRGSGWATEAVFLGGLPALLLFPPLLREAFEGLGLRLAAPSMILVLLGLTAILPLLGPIVSPRRSA